MGTFCCLRTLSDKEFPIPASPDYPELRIGTQLDALYTRLLRDGRGFRNPAVKDGLPVVIVVFDPCCAWSHLFWEAMFEIRDRIDFRWYPVCVSQDQSTRLGAEILSAEEPWEAMADYQEEFEGRNNRQELPVTQEMRDFVWKNARLFRKSGGTSVPLAIFKDKEGVYHPFFAQDSLSYVLKTVV